MNSLFQGVRWCARVFEEGSSGNPSVKRIALMVTVTALAIALIILAAAAFMGHSVGAEITAVATSLAGVGGYSYVRGKAAERASGGPA